MGHWTAEHSLTEAVTPDNGRGSIKNLMRTRTAIIPSVMLAIAISLWAGPLGGQPGQPSRNDEPTNEVYSPSVTPAIYLVNFVLLYVANPAIAAYMPAYKAPIPEAVVDCLEQNPTGCPYADYRQYFENPHGGGDQNRRCFWPRSQRGCCSTDSQNAVTISAAGESSRSCSERCR